MVQRKKGPFNMKETFYVFNNLYGTNNWGKVLW